MKLELKKNVKLTKIRRLRIENEVGLKPFASAIGSDCGTWSKIERGERPLTLNHILSLAKFYNLKPWQILQQIEADYRICD